MLSKIRTADLEMLAKLRYHVVVGNKARRLRFMLRDLVTGQVVAKLATMSEIEEYKSQLVKNYIIQLGVASDEPIKASVPSP